jgi:hypothetical protein
MLRAFPSDSTKFQILVRQKFACAQISDYNCPIAKCLFDEAGYDVDHVLPLADGGSNDITNLQALCPSCHRVKTARENRERDRVRSATTSTATSPATSQASSVTTPEYITDLVRVKHRVADYIHVHYTIGDGNKLPMSKFLADYAIWEHRKVNKQKKLPCDIALVKKVAISLAEGGKDWLRLTPKLSHK